MRSMTNADVPFDTNIIVGYLDPGDSQHLKATWIAESLRRAGFNLVLLDFIVEETLSVLCRRARERKVERLPLRAAISIIEAWDKAGRIQHTGEILAMAFPRLLDIIKDSDGALNTNDAKLVFLQRSGYIFEVATFDRNLAATPDFRCVALPSSFL